MNIRFTTWQLVIFCITVIVVAGFICQTIVEVHK